MYAQRATRRGLRSWLVVPSLPETTVDQVARGAPARPRLADDVVPLAADLMVGWTLATADPSEFVGGLASQRRRPDENHHHAKQSGDHREHRPDDPVTRGIGTEQ